MGFFATRRINKAVEAVYEAFDKEREEPFQAIDDLGKEEQLPALLKLAEKLADEEAYDHARPVLERALELDPKSWGALGLLAHVERDDPERRHQAIDALRRLLEVDPGNTDVIADLALLLIQTDRAEEALTLLREIKETENPVLVLRVGEALVSLGRLEEALAALTAVRKMYSYRLQHGMLQTEGEELRENLAEAARLFSQVYTEVHGEPPGAAIAAPLGAAYARGSALLAASSRIAQDLRLQDPETTAKAAKTRLADDDQDAGALALLGSALLREGDPAGARKRFEAAVEADATCFAPHLGLAAVDLTERFDLRGLAQELPLAEELASLDRVFPDSPALTDLEFQVLYASTEPLRDLLPDLADASVCLRILPIDVRPADLDELEGASRQPHLGVTRIESLLDTESPQGWMLAHELAVLAHPHLPDDLAQDLAGLHHEAREAAATAATSAKPDEEVAADPGTEEDLGESIDGEETGDDATADDGTGVPEDPALFFAHCYVDFLRYRHGRGDYRLIADEAVHDQVVERLSSLVTGRGDS